jgi:peptidyl-prolyl cis-trans isomerase C
MSRVFLASMIAICLATGCRKDSAQQSSGSPSGSSAMAADAPPQQPSPSPAAPSPGGILATVNGQPILQSDLDIVVDRVIAQQTGGRQVPPQMIDQFRASIRPQVLETLIDNRLLDQQVTEAKITVTAEEAMAEAERGLAAQLTREGATREEFAERVQASGMGMTLDQALTQQANDPGFRQTIAYAELLEQKYPDLFAISPAQVQERYDRDRDSAFTKPEMVRASHILFSTQNVQTPQEQDAAKEKATAVLAEVQKPDADFAALAKQHSQCPSAASGGDLGFFPRQGVMVEPFAAAAFELQPGAFSSVVETPFGYHIIKVTERKPAHVVPLEEADAAIRDELRMEQLLEARQQHIAKLRQDAKITYTNGPPAPASPASPPAVTPAPAPRATTPPASAPSEVPTP